MTLTPLLQTLYDDLRSHIILGETLSIDPALLKEAGAPIAALFPQIGIDALNLRGSFLFTPAEDGKTFTLTGGLLENTTLGLKNSPVHLLFGENNDHLTAIISFNASTQRMFSDAIPSLSDNANADYSFQQAVYTLSTHTTEDLIPGLNFSALMDISDTTNTRSLREFAPDTPASLAVKGPVLYDNNTFSIFLTPATTLSAKTLIIDGLTHLEFPALTYSILLNYTVQTGHSYTEQGLSAHVSIGGTTLPLSIVLPFAGSGYQLRYTAPSNQAVTCPGLEEFLRFIDGYSLISIAQGACPLTGEFTIHYLAIGISADLSEFTQLNLSVSAAPSVRWDVAGQQLSLGDISIVFNLLHKNGNYHATGHINAAYAITDSLKVALRLPIPLSNSDWIFTATASSEMQHMGDVSTVLGGTPLARLLPCNLGNNKGTLGSLAVHYSPTQSSIKQVAFNFSSSVEWEIIPNRLSFKEVQLALTAYSPYSMENISARILGVFSIGDAALTATLAKDDNTSPWILAIQAESVNLGRIGDMTQLIGSEIGLNTLLPSCITDTQITLDALNIALALTPTPKLETINFSLTARNTDTKWELIGNNILTINDLNFTAFLQYDAELSATLYLGAGLTFVGADFAVGASRDSESNWLLSAELAPDSSINLSRAFNTFIPGTSDLLSAIGMPDVILESAGIEYDVAAGAYTMHATIGSGGTDPLWTILNTPNFAVNHLGLECEGNSQSGAGLSITALLLTSTLNIGSAQLPLALDVKALGQRRFTIAYHPNGSDLPTLKDLIVFVADDFASYIPSVIENIAETIALRKFSLTVADSSYTLALQIGSPPSWESPPLFPIVNWRIKNFFLDITRTNASTTGLLQAEFSFIGEKPLTLSMRMPPGNELIGVYEEDFTVGALIRYLAPGLPIPDIIDDLGLKKLEVVMRLDKVYFELRQYLSGEIKEDFWGFKGIALVITYDNGKLTICLCGILEFESGVTVKCCFCGPFDRFRPEDPEKPPIPYPPRRPTPPPPDTPVVPISDGERHDSWEAFRKIVGATIALATVATAIYSIVNKPVFIGKQASTGAFLGLKQFSEAAQKGPQLISSTASVINKGVFLNAAFTAAAFITIGVTIMAIARTMQNIKNTSPSDFVKGMHESAGADVATPKNAIELLEKSKDSFGGLTNGQIAQGLSGTYNAQIALPALYEAFQLGSAAEAAEFIHTHYQEGGVIIPIMDMAAGLFNVHHFSFDQIADALLQKYQDSPAQEYANALANIGTPPATTAKYLLVGYSTTFTDHADIMITTLQTAYQTTATPITTLAVIAEALATSYIAILTIPALYNSSYKPQDAQHMANTLAAYYTAPQLAPGLLTVYRDIIPSASIMASTLRTAYGDALLINTMAQALAACSYTVADAIPVLNTIYGAQDAQTMANALAFGYKAMDMAPALVKTYSTTITSALQCGTILKTAYSQAGTPLSMNDMAQTLTACDYALVQIIPVLQALYTSLGLQAMADALAPVYPATEVAPALLAVYGAEITSALILATTLKQAYRTTPNPLPPAGMADALMACSYMLVASTPAIATLYFPTSATQEDSIQLATVMVNAYKTATAVQLGAALTQCSNIAYANTGKAITAALPNTPLPIIGALLFLLQDASLPAAITQATSLAASGKTVLEAAPLIASHIPSLDIATLAAALTSCYHVDTPTLDKALILSRGQAVHMGQVAVAIIILHEILDASQVAIALATATQASSVALIEISLAKGLFYAFERIAQPLTPENAARAVVSAIPDTDSTKIAKAFIAVMQLPTSQQSSYTIINILRAAFENFTAHQAIESITNAFSLPIAAQEEIENILRPTANAFQLTAGQPSVGVLVAACNIAGITNMLAVGNIIPTLIKDWQESWVALILMAYNNSDWAIAYDAVVFGRKNGPETVVQKVVENAINEGRSVAPIRMVEMLVSLFDLYSLPNDMTFLAHGMKHMQTMPSPYTFQNTLPACQAFFGNAWTMEATNVLSREFA